MKKQAILLTLCLVAVLVSVSAVSAADTFVNDSVTASGDGSSWIQAFKTIQEGVTGVTEGNTVNIAAGTYTGNDNKGIVVDKNITIQGAGQDQTIIDCQGSGRAFRIYDKTVTIKNLTIKNGTEEDGGAIRNGGNLAVIGCTFTGNTATGYGGAVETDNNLTITSCTFINNHANSGGAIYNGGIYLTISNSLFQGNTAIDIGGAIENYGNGVCTVTGSIFNSNTAHLGGAISNSAILNATGCNFYNNIATTHGGAIYGNGNYQGVTSDNKIKYSRFVGNTPEDIYLNMDTTMSPVTLLAQFNWWGSNNGPTTGRISGTSLIPIMPNMYTPWLMLNINADPTTIYTGGTSTITANVYTDSNGVNHSADAAQFFSGPQVTFTTNLGKIGSDSITVPWVLGQAIRPLVANEGPGTAHVTAADGQVVSTDVTILQAPAVNAATSTEGTVGMQETGIPIAGLILAILAVFGGLVASKR